MKCIVCESLKAKLEIARKIGSSDMARVAYTQMREHRSRVKHPNKHGLKGGEQK